MIFIPEPNQQVAGPQTFLRNLSDYLKKVKYPYTFDINKATGILCSPVYPLEQVERIKSRGGKVIQRLDGVYYPEKHGDIYEELNSDVRFTYNTLADYAIFQSEYSRQMCFAMFGKIPEEKYTTIINGVNKKIFSPNRKLKLKKNINFITTGNFRSIDMLEPIIKSLDEIVTDNNFPRNREFKLHIAGPIVPELIHLTKRDYVVLHGEKNMKAVAKLLKNSHIFLYSHLNPPCPNSVIEAISVGIPVVGFNSGSMKELLYFSPDLLADINDKIFQSDKDYNYKDLKDRIVLCLSEFKKYRELALEYINLYSFEECGDRYIDVFNKTI